MTTNNLHFMPPPTDLQVGQQPVVAPPVFVGVPPHPAAQQLPAQQPQQQVAPAQPQVQPQVQVQIPAELQGQVNQIGAAEHGKGVTAGKREVLAALGFTDLPALTAFVDAAKTGRQSDSDLQKQVDGLQGQVRDLTGANGRMNLNAMATEILLGQGVRQDRVAGAVQLLLADPAVATNPEGVPDRQALSTIAGDFRNRYAEWFAPPLQLANGQPIEGQPQQVQQFGDPNQQQQVFGQQPSVQPPPQAYGQPPAQQPAGTHPSMVPTVAPVGSAPPAPGIGGNAASAQVQAGDAMFNALHGDVIRQKQADAMAVEARRRLTLQ